MPAKEHRSESPTQEGRIILAGMIQLILFTDAQETTLLLRSGGLVKHSPQVQNVYIQQKISP